MRLPCFHNLIGLLRLSNAEPVGNEGLWRYLSFSNEIQEGRHVALLGPPDIGDRIIIAGELVRGIVPPRPIGHGQPEIQLAFVEWFAINGHSHKANDDDAALERG